MITKAHKDIQISYPAKYIHFNSSKFFSLIDSLWYYQQGFELVVKYIRTE